MFFKSQPTFTIQRVRNLAPTAGSFETQSSGDTPSCPLRDDLGLTAVRPAGNKVLQGEKRKENIGFQDEVTLVYGTCKFRERACGPSSIFK